MNNSRRDGCPREPALSEVEESVPSQARQSLCRWLKFNAVGGAGIVVQLGALAAFRSWLKLDYLLATGLAVEIAVVHNFLWHERYTWADRPATGAMQSLFRLPRSNPGNGAFPLAGNFGRMRCVVGKSCLTYAPAKLMRAVVCCLGSFLLGYRFAL